jgi:hypothetical protein
MQFLAILQSESRVHVDNTVFPPHTQLVRLLHWILHFNQFFLNITIFHINFTSKSVERPLLSPTASRLGIHPRSGQHSEADWLTRANIGAGT